MLKLEIKVGNESGDGRVNIYLLTKENNIEKVLEEVEKHGIKNLVEKERSE